MSQTDDVPPSDTTSDERRLRFEEHGLDAVTDGDAGPDDIGTTADAVDTEDELDPGPDRDAGGGGDHGGDRGGDRDGPIR